MKPELGAVIRTRRASLGLSQADVVAARGPSDNTLRKIERGEPGPYRAQSTAALDRILKWKPGTTQAILNGTAGSDQKEWEAEETQSSPDHYSEVVHVGMQFIDLLGKRCGDNPRVLPVQRAVIDLLTQLSERV